MHQQIKYPYFNPNPATQGECCACREPPAQVQHCADTHSRNQNLCGQANTTKYWEPACFITLRLMGTRPRSSHLSRKSYSTYLFFFLALPFWFVYTNELSGACILALLQRECQSRRAHAVSSSKTSYFYHFTKPQHFCCLQDGEN